MLSRQGLKIAINKVEAFPPGCLNREQRERRDIAVGLLYEAYGQMRLDERRLNVDLTRICGFIRYIGIMPLTFAGSAR
jgi:hypothetical protein